MTTLYETDTYGWALQQAEALRAAARLKLNTPLALDWENLAEEIEDLGKSRARELSSRYYQLLAHLLKWEFQPDKRTPSWRATVSEQRSEIREVLSESRSLKPQREERLRAAYGKARRLAGDETGKGLDAFPEENPYTLDQVMDYDFWPGPPWDRD